MDAFPTLSVDPHQGAVVEDCGVQACCGCGVVQLTFGETTLKLSPSSFAAVLASLNHIARELAHRGALQSRWPEMSHCYEQ